MVGISVIVIACPCALALATPVATLVGLSLGAKRGILFKEAAQLETMAKADTVVFDKTGTLTVGKPEVLKETLLEDFNKELLYALVANSKHPIAQGIKKYVRESNFQTLSFESFEQIPAQGIRATIDTKTLLGGNATLMDANGVVFEYESNNSLFYFAINKELVAVYELSDTIKEGAKELVSNLKKKNIQTIMLTGDNARTAHKIANEVGIEVILSEQTPENKADYIQKLHDDSKTVIMVGDGVNDVLALARADIGIVMGNGSDIAVDVSDVVLMQDSLTSFEDAMKISRTTYGLIKQNLGISLVYNAITIPLAMAGFVIPLVAAISMSVSSLLVVGNSMRIKLKWKKD
jgi:Cu+-exporting ATPase